MKRTLSLLLLFLFPMILSPTDSRAEGPVVARHAIEAALDPAAKTLTLRDTITLSTLATPRKPSSYGTTRAELILNVNANAVFTDVPPRATFRNGLLRVRLAQGQTLVALAYSLPLTASAPSSESAGQASGHSRAQSAGQAPAMSLMDTPGALAEGAMAGPDWAMLMPASRWHPEALGLVNAYTLRVTAPPGVRVASQGRLQTLEDRPDATISTWIVDHPVGRLGLCAARYTVEQDDSGPVPVLTFLLTPNAGLAGTYLQASVRHLRFYQERIGPYPFEKFAVVENPLPTGYGFPSYTLLGSQVLRLPFIPETSLRHEIAHNWWGNGVLVDASQGNWCEGLTVYVADYLSKELESPAAGLDYRRQTLRAFAALARSGRDFPLARFGMRFSPASQAVGYGKAMFVFHMLRAQVGDAAFWAGLRRFYAAKLFQEATWEDIRMVFAGLPGFSEPESRRFFRQWLTRTGGPILKLVDGRTAGTPVRTPPPSTTAHGQTPTDYATSARLLQEGTPYALRLPVRLNTPEGPVLRRVAANGPSTSIGIESAAKPLRLSVDPGADVFRVLGDAEIPASVNTVKGRAALLVILARDATPAVRAALPALLTGLNHPEARMVEEDRMPPALEKGLANMDILFVGAPRNRSLLELPPGLSLTPGGFTLDDALGVPDAIPSVAAPLADTLLVVLPRAGSARFSALFTAMAWATPQDVAQAAAKVTHYGRFSVLAFAQGRNVAKSTVESGASPLTWEFR